MPVFGIVGEPSITELYYFTAFVRNKILAGSCGAVHHPCFAPSPCTLLCALLRRSAEDVLEAEAAAHRVRQEEDVARLQAQLAR